MFQQLPLNIRLRASATFANFYAAGNEQLVAALRDDTEPFLYLWGNEGCGKSHLLQAVCHSLASRKTSAYIPLEMSGLAPDMLEGLESLDVVCIDNVHLITGITEWEMALFHLYNRLRDQGRRLVVAAHVSPARLGVSLPDLHSRFTWGSVYNVLSLDDAGKRWALQVRAREQGVELPDEVVGYLLKRYTRNPGALFELLERLDEASLAAQRRLTVPFVSGFLDQLA